MTRDEIVKALDKLQLKVYREAYRADRHGKPFVQTDKYKIWESLIRGIAQFEGATVEWEGVKDG